MKCSIRHMAAALLAAGAVSLAGAQSTAPEAKAPHAQEPIASPVRTQGPQAEVEASVVEALKADPSLEGSKITVAAESDTVLLTGVTLTNAQKKRAGEIAAARLGVPVVINAIVPSEV